MTSIGAYAFSGCSGLQSVSIPSGVKTIGNYAFIKCNGLTTVDISGSEASIGSCAFQDCTNLNSLTIKNGVKSIGSNSFYGCYNLSTIVIPSSVTSVGNTAFSGCYVTADNLDNKSTIDLSLYGLTIVDTEQEDGLLIKGNSAVFCRKWAKNVTIPNGVTTITKESFRGIGSLQHVTIAGSVTSIGDRAFLDCKDLTSVTFYSFPKIGNTVFSGVPSTCTYNLILSDGSYVYTENNSYFPIHTTNPTYTRTLTREWETLVLPFEISISENDNYDFCTITGLTEASLNCQIATGTLAAGTPVLIHKKVDGDYNLILEASNSTISTTIITKTITSVFGYKGTFTTVSLDSGAGYVLDGSSFKKTTETTNVDPFRVYLQAYTGYTFNGGDVLSLPHVHKLTKTEAVAATCTSTGNIDYWTCSSCGKIYSDAAGETEIPQRI